MPTLVWEIIWINLCNISPLVKWFITNVDSGSIYSKAILKTKYEDQYQEGLTTFSYSLDALSIHSLHHRLVENLIKRAILVRLSSYVETIMIYQSML